MSKFCGGCGTALAPDVRFCESCGKPAARPVGQGATPAPPQRPAEFTAPRTSKRPFVVVGVVLGALVVVGVSVSVVQALLFSPKATVRAFFADLSDGDATSAKKRIDATTSTSSGTPLTFELLSDDVLSAKSYVAPTDVEVTDIDEDVDGDEEDDERRVKVSYVVDGQRKTTQLSLDRSDDRTLLFFRTWRINHATATLALPVGVPYQVNGVALKDVDAQIGRSGSEVEDDVESLTYQLFPGRYDVGVAENPLLSGEGKQVTMVLNSETARLSLTTSVKDTAKAEVEKQVKAYIDECAEETTVQPKNCPFGTYASSDRRNVKWTVVTYPKIEMHQTSSGSVYVQTGEYDSGSATVTYEAKSYFSDEYESQTSTSQISVGGAVVVKNGKIDWQSPKDYAKNGSGG